MQVGIINFTDISENNSIIKPNFHLNYGKKRIVNAIKNGLSISTLKACTENIYTGGIFKRIFVEDESCAIPYISAQHMMHFNPLEVAKSISKKFTPRQDDMTLRTGQILVSCAGTVGNVRIVDSFLDGIIGSQDIIRVIAGTTNFPRGYIYAYLCSPTAFNYIQSFIYGSVVPRIDPTTLGTLPVPILEKRLMQSVDKKAFEASLTRDKAYNALTTAVGLLENRLPVFKVPKIHTEVLSTISNSRKRLDATFSTTAINFYQSKIEQTGAKLETIGNLSSDVFTPNIFKRIKVDKNKGSVPYLGGAELLHYRPIFDTFLSRKTKNLNSYLLKKDYLAFQDSGSIQSIGYVSLVPDYCHDVAATNNLVRVIPCKTRPLNRYIYAYCKTNQANSILKSLAYGTGQLHIDTEIINSFKIPIYSDLIDKIDQLVLDYQRFIGEAFELENEAIRQIENEIDKWQK